jgi:hypothetical protein
MQVFSYNETVNKKTLEGESNMFDHQYILSEFQKQRANEIKKMMVETNRSKKKPFSLIVPIFKRSNDQIYH